MSKLFKEKETIPKDEAPAGAIRKLVDTTVHFISIVDKGANQKTILFKNSNKAKEGQVDFSTSIRIVKIDEVKKRIYGVVYTPDETDTDGEYMDAETIEKMSFDFMKAGKTTNVDRDHSFETGEGYIAESWIIKESDAVFPEEKEGAWVVVIQVEKDDTWDAVVSGELTGLSLAGFAKPIDVEKIEKKDTKKNDITMSLGIDVDPEVESFMAKIRKQFTIPIILLPGILEKSDVDQLAVDKECRNELRKMIHKGMGSEYSFTESLNSIGFVLCWRDLFWILDDVLWYIVYSSELTLEEKNIKISEALSVFDIKMKQILSVAYDVTTKSRENIITEEISNMLKNGKEITLTEDELKNLLAKAVTEALSKVAEPEKTADPEKEKVIEKVKDDVTKSESKEDSDITAITKSLKTLVDSVEKTNTTIADVSERLTKIETARGITNKVDPEEPSIGDEDPESEKELNKNAGKSWRAAFTKVS